jgi:hypothetical protein
MATRMQQRKGTAEQWLSTNGGDGPVLNAGEIGYEIDTNKFKIGDGISHWIDLNYFADAVALGGDIDDYIPLTQKGVAGGVATLNGDGVIPSEQIPSLVGLDTEIASAVSTAVNNLVDSAPGALNTLNELAAAIGDDADYASTVTNALALKAPINNPTFTGTVAGVTKAHVGLENVNNSSDADKPVSTATQTALDLKAPLESPTFTGTVSGVTKSHVGLSDVDNTSDADKPVSDATATALNLKQDASSTAADAVTAVINKLADGTGIDITQDPTTKVITVAVDSTIATEGYVDDAIAAFDSLPTQTGNDGKFLQTNGSTTLWAAVDLSTYAPLANPTFTGTVSGITATMVGLGNLDNTSDANKPVSTATQTALDLKANLAGPTFTGTTTTDDLVVEGDLTVTGTTTTINATDLSITDPLIYLASEQYTEDVLDVGFLAATGAPGGTAESHLHSGFFRDASDSKKWKLVSNVPHPIGNVVDITNATKETLVVGALEATSATINSDTVATLTATQTLTNKTLTAPVIVNSINAQAASYTAVLGDANKFVEMGVGSANTFTVPANSSVAFPIGSTINVIQTGSGQTTITPEGGVTINGTPGLKTRAQWSAVTLVKRATDTWVAFGDLTA